MEINEIRPSHLALGAAEAYKKDLDFYKAIKVNFIERSCPACEQTSLGNQILVKDDLSYSTCRSCACIFMNPGPTEKILEDFYNGSENYKFWSKYMYPESRARRAQTLHRERAEWILDTFIQKSAGVSNLTVLEHGAGTGDTLRVLLDSDSFEINGFATEPNINMKDNLEENAVQVLTLDELNQTAFNSAFDAIFCFEVLEHLLQPVDFLQQVWKNLKRGGYFFASTPNAQSLEVQLLSESSSTIDIEHISLLTPAAVHALAGKSGFLVEEITTPGSLDLELIRNEKCNLFLTTKNGELDDQKAQQFMAKSGFSSHMKLKLRKP